MPPSRPPRPRDPQPQRSDSGPGSRTGSRLLDGAALVLVLALLGLLAVRQVASPDVGFHLRAGNHVLAGEGWPRTDPFTYTLGDHPYIDTTWGYQVVLAWLESVLGASGLVLFHVALVVAIFLLLARTALLAPVPPRLLLVLLLLGGLACEVRFETRPELLSYAFLAAICLVLHRYAEGRGTALWPLAVLFLLWQNCHGLYVVGWGALACFNFGLLLQRRRLDRRLLGWSTACVLLSLVNPYGWRSLQHSLHLATRLQRGSAFAGRIGEFESPFAKLFSPQLGFHVVDFPAFFLLVGCVVVAAWFLWRQRRYASLALCIVFVPLSLTMVRNMPFVVVACLPATVQALPVESLLQRWRHGPRLRPLLGYGIPGAVVLFVLVFGLRVWNDAYYVERRRTERFGWGWNSLALPVDAAAYVRQTDLPGNMLNHLNIGGYLDWAVPQPTFIDGRLEVVREEFYRYYHRVLADPETREACVGRYDIGWTIFPYHEQPDYLQALSGDERWQLTYFDRMVAVFVRADRVSADHVHDSVRRLEAAPPAPPDLESLPGMGFVRRPGRLGRFLDGLWRRQSFPLQDYSLAYFHYWRGDVDRFLHHTAEAIRTSRGAFYEPYENLGIALREQGRLIEARRCFAIVLAEIPFYRADRRELIERWFQEADSLLSRGSR